MKKFKIFYDFHYAPAPSLNGVSTQVHHAIDVADAEVKFMEHVHMFHVEDSVTFLRAEEVVPGPVGKWISYDNMRNGKTDDFVSGRQRMTWTDYLDSFFQFEGDVVSNNSNLLIWNGEFQ